MAAWTPSKTPWFSMRTLPPPYSSAGVPKTFTVRSSSSATAARLIPASTPEAAMMLCPHACPTPGSASISAQMPTTNGPVP